MYIYERKNWPHFTWDAAGLTLLLAKVRFHQGRLVGRMSALGTSLRHEAWLQILALDVVSSARMEGEMLDERQVRSALARALSLPIGNWVPPERKVTGMSDMVLNATRRWDLPLTKSRLLAWHLDLFPVRREDPPTGINGTWRNAVGSGSSARSSSRQSAPNRGPSSARVPEEMKRFLAWVESRGQMEPVLKAALAHFWLVTIQPFNEGNGRIARAVTDLMLARSEESSQRFYSLSAQLQQEQTAYHAVLESCQKGDLDITLWMSWFLDCLLRAIGESERALEAVMVKDRFWNDFEGVALNERQAAMIGNLLGGFEGKLTSTTWAKMMKCSQDTASRDINDLLERKVLVNLGAGGRSTGYALRLTG